MHPVTAGLRAAALRRGVFELVWRPVDGGRAAVVARARHWLGRSLPQLIGLDARGGLHDDTELLVSELATNAVLHAGGVAAVRLRVAGEILRVTVCDRAEAMPAARIAEVHDEHGRGFALVAALAGRWGVDRDQALTGKCVWLELSITGSP